MAKKENTIKEAKIVKRQVLEILPNEQTYQTTTIVVDKKEIKPTIEDLLTSINDKLAILIKNDETATDITKMSLTDLKFIKETLSENIRIHNCPSGDANIVNDSYSLITKIMIETNNRINLLR